MSTFIDADAILSEHEQWLRLEQQWGTPVDLDTEDDAPGTTTAVSTLDLLKSTFDSSYLLKKVKKHLSKESVHYQDFLQHLHQARTQQFCFSNEQILLAASIEDFCDNIDGIFSSVTRRSATSTVSKPRKLKPRHLPEVVGCSFSASGLSFDDTLDASEKEQDYDDINRYIDEVFAHLDATLESLASEHLDPALKESVTTLVREFTGILKDPGLTCSPRRRRECCDKFRGLIDFWEGKI